MGRAVLEKSLKFLLETQVNVRVVHESVIGSSIHLHKMRV